MTSIQFETRRGDVDPRRASPHFFYPLATIKCVGSPIFRSQDTRDFACLLDLDPDVLSWTCVGVGYVFHGADAAWQGAYSAAAARLVGLISS
jgi:hypothetical protein